MDVISKLRTKYIITCVISISLIFLSLGVILLTMVRNEMDRQNVLFLLKIFLPLFICVLVVSVVLGWFFSIWAVKPVEKVINKQKRFISDASHELKTPLSSIRANLDVLVEETGENKWTEYIRDEVDHMSSLVKDLLTLARFENSNQRLEMQSFDLSGAILRAVLPYESKCFEEGRTLVMDITPGITMKGDERSIKQVAVIFLDNAIKYSEQGSVITVAVRKEGKQILVAVRNTGQGIEDNQKTKVFERFYRVDSSHNRDTGGYGLGLSIAQGIAEQHHGHLELESIPGQYVEFKMVL
ncbi:MAG: ATP-binding protein [Treponemataceae bacterium]|nr:ATP-binding protein [Treponemataceae bacterium]